MRGPCSTRTTTNDENNAEAEEKEACFLLLHAYDSSSMLQLHVIGYPSGRMIFRWA